MSESKSNRWLLIFGGAGVVALVIGLFVLMSADAPAGTPNPVPSRVFATTKNDPGAASDHATIGPSTPTSSPAPRTPAAPPPEAPSPPIVHDHSDESQNDPRRQDGVPPQIQNNVFRNVTPALTQCSPPRPADGDGKPRGFATVSYTVVVDQGKVTLDQVDATGSALSPEHLTCIKQAFSAVTFDSPADQTPGRFPITLQFAVP